MSCAMIYWNSEIEHFSEVFSEFGAVVDIRGLQQSLTARALG
jgi:hypothetical protein